LLEIPSDARHQPHLLPQLSLKNQLLPL
jgi:hypothetical protein